MDQHLQCKDINELVEAFSSIITNLLPAHRKAQRLPVKFSQMYKMKALSQYTKVRDIKIKTDIIFYHSVYMLMLLAS